MIYRLEKTEKTATTTAPATPAAVAAAPAAPGPPQPLPQLLHTSKVPCPVARSQKISRPEYAKKPLFGVDAGIIDLFIYMYYIRGMGRQCKQIIAERAKHAASIG